MPPTSDRSRRTFLKAAGITLALPFLDALAPKLKAGEFEPKRSGCSLNLVQFQNGAAIADIDQGSQAPETRRNFTQKFDAFASKIDTLQR